MPVLSVISFSLTIVYTSLSVCISQEYIYINMKIQRDKIR